MHKNVSKYLNLFFSRWASKSNVPTKEKTLEMYGKRRIMTFLPFFSSFFCCCLQQFEYKHTLCCAGQT